LEDYSLPTFNSNKAMQMAKKPQSDSERFFNGLLSQPLERCQLAKISSIHNYTRLMVLQEIEK
jgi:hypothetical protein